MDYSPADSPVSKKPAWQIALAWFLYISVLAFILIGSTILLERSASAEEGAYLDTQMTRSEFTAHMDGYYEQVVDAIYVAEGGARAKKPFGILSVPCDGYADCRAVCKNTVRNNYVRWIKAGRPGGFIAFLGGRYAPVGAKNDPTGLNAHWTRNVNAILNANLS